MMLLDLFFPAICLHCKGPLSKIDSLLCLECSRLLELLGPSEHCCWCFQSLQEHSACSFKDAPIERFGAALSYSGPAMDLMREMKYHGRPLLAKSLASFMVMQFQRLDWPMPDLIVPVPQSFVRKLLRGYSTSAMLAYEVAHMLDVPCKELLKRRSGDFPQARLGKEQRRALQADAFNWKKREMIDGKTILLIDDVATTGSTIIAAASVLAEGFPAAIYALTCCL